MLESKKKEISNRVSRIWNIEQYLVVALNKSIRHVKKKWKNMRQPAEIIY